MMSSYFKQIIQEQLPLPAHHSTNHQPNHQLQTNDANQLHQGAHCFAQHQQQATAFQPLHYQQSLHGAFETFKKTSHWLSIQEGWQRDIQQLKCWSDTQGYYGQEEKILIHQRLDAFARTCQFIGHSSADVAKTWQSFTRLAFAQITHTILGSADLSHHAPYAKELDVRKRLLLSLIDGLHACLPGIASRIIDLQEKNLLTRRGHAMLTPWLQAKRWIIAETIHRYVHHHHQRENNLSVWEIHIYNHYHNQIAHWLGLKTIPDSFEDGGTTPNTKTNIDHCTTRIYYQLRPNYLAHSLANQQLHQLRSKLDDILEQEPHLSILEHIEQLIDYAKIELAIVNQHGETPNQQALFVIDDDGQLSIQQDPVLLTVFHLETMAEHLSKSQEDRDSSEQHTNDLAFQIHQRFIMRLENTCFNKDIWCFEPNLFVSKIITTSQQPWETLTLDDLITLLEKNPSNLHGKDIATLCLQCVTTMESSARTQFLTQHAKRLLGVGLPTELNAFDKLTQRIALENPGWQDRLLTYATEHHNYLLIRTALALGADIHLLMPNGETLLTHTIKQPSTHTIKLATLKMLIDRGGDLTRQNADQQTVFSNLTDAQAIPELMGIMSWTANHRGGPHSAAIACAAHLFLKKPSMFLDCYLKTERIEVQNLLYGCIKLNKANYPQACHKLLEQVVAKQHNLPSQIRNARLDNLTLLLDTLRPAPRAPFFHQASAPSPHRQR